MLYPKDLLFTLSIILYYDFQLYFQDNEDILYDFHAIDATALHNSNEVAPNVQLVRISIQSSASNPDGQAPPITAMATFLLVVFLCL